MRKVRGLHCTCTKHPFHRSEVLSNSLPTSGNFSHMSFVVRKPVFRFAISLGSIQPAQLQRLGRIMFVCRCVGWYVHLLHLLFQCKIVYIEGDRLYFPQV